MYFLPPEMCRVCERLSCCSTHRIEHELKSHENDLPVLSKLPGGCKKCRKIIFTLSDYYNSKCSPTKVHVITKSTFYSRANADVLKNGQHVQNNRKRSLDDHQPLDGDTDLLTEPVEQRKILVPSFKLRKKSSSTSNLILNIPIKSVMEIRNEVTSSTPVYNKIDTVDFEVEMNFGLGKKIISSLFEFSENKYSSFTPVDDNGTLGRMEIFRSGTPSSKSSLNQSKKRRSCKTPVVQNERKVTFILNSDSDSSVNTPDVLKNDSPLSVYSTPLETMEENEENELPETYYFSDFAKKVQMAICQMPKSFISRWTSRINNKRNHNEIEEITDQRINYVPRKRMPISSISALPRSPLPSYKQRYSKLKLE